MLPEYQFSERHGIWLDTSPEVALAAARNVSLDDMPLARLLMRMRGLRTPARGSLWDKMVSGQFIDLGEIPGREIAAGVIGQMWKLSGGQSPKVASPIEFAAFDALGYAKAAMGFAAQSTAGRCELVTETRVWATDEASRRAFSRYWTVIRPGSGLIRRVWLGAAKRRAEAS